MDHPAVPALLLAFALAPYSAAAQAAARPADPGRAVQLIARAEYLVQTNDLNAGARLFEEAGTLFPRTDPRASHALRSAGQTYRLIGKPFQAMQLLERSGELATWRGDLTEAADTYVNALFIALGVNARAEARRFIDRAISLTASPAMPEADRQRILRRISQPAVELGGYTDLVLPALRSAARGVAQR